MERRQAGELAARCRSHGLAAAAWADGAVVVAGAGACLPGMGRWPGDRWPAGWLATHTCGVLLGLVLVQGCTSHVARWLSVSQAGLCRLGLPGDLAAQGAVQQGVHGGHAELQQGPGQGRQGGRAEGREAGQRREARHSWRCSGVCVCGNGAGAGGEEGMGVWRGKHCPFQANSLRC